MGSCLKRSAGFINAPKMRHAAADPSIAIECSTAGRQRRDRAVDAGASSQARAVKLPEIFVENDPPLVGEHGLDGSRLLTASDAEGEAVINEEPEPARRRLLGNAGSLGHRRQRQDRRQSPGYVERKQDIERRLAEHGRIEKPATKLARLNRGKSTIDQISPVQLEYAFAEPPSARRSRALAPTIGIGIGSVLVGKCIAPRDVRHLPVR